MMMIICAVNEDPMQCIVSEIWPLCICIIFVRVRVEHGTEVEWIRRAGFSDLLFCKGEQIYNAGKFEKNQAQGGKVWDPVWSTFSVNGKTTILWKRCGGHRPWIFQLPKQSITDRWWWFNDDGDDDCNGDDDDDNSVDDENVVGW